VKFYFVIQILKDKFKPSGLKWRVVFLVVLFPSISSSIFPSTSPSIPNYLCEAYKDPNVLTYIPVGGLKISQGKTNRCRGARVKNADKIVAWVTCTDSRFWAKYGNHREKNTQCGSLNISKNFFEFFKKNFPKCLERAAENAGLVSKNAKIISVGLTHAGAYSCRTVNAGTRVSIHATGRAIDLKGVVADFDDGSKLDVSFNKHEGSKVFKKTDYLAFYNNIRECWSDKIREVHPGCKLTGKDKVLGSVGGSGSYKPAQSNHNGHLHLSYPYCDRRRWAFSQN